MVEATEILGLDVGAKHIGIARASSIARLAEPLRSMSTEDAIKMLLDYFKKHNVEAVAVSLPRNLKGEDTDQTLWVRQWVDKLKQELDVSFYWQDEALTSQQAASKLKALKGSQLTVDEHAIAAAILLQDFLDSPEGSRVLA